MASQMARAGRMPAPAMIMIAVPSSLVFKGFLRSGDSTSSLLVKCIAIINALDAFVLASCVGTRIYLPRERLVSRSRCYRTRFFPNAFLVRGFGASTSFHEIQVPKRV